MAARSAAMPSTDFRMIESCNRVYVLVFRVVGIQRVRHSTRDGCQEGSERRHKVREAIHQDGVLSVT